MSEAVILLDVYNFAQTSFIILCLHAGPSQLSRLIKRGLLFLFPVDDHLFRLNSIELDWLSKQRPKLSPIETFEGKMH